MWTGVSTIFTQWDWRPWEEDCAVTGVMMGQGGP